MMNITNCALCSVTAATDAAGATGEHVWGGDGYCKTWQR